MKNLLMSAMNMFRALAHDTVSFFCFAFNFSFSFFGFSFFATPSSAITA